MIKNKYDTSVIFLYAIGKENLLPIEFLKKFPTQLFLLGEKPITVTI